MAPFLSTVSADIDDSFMQMKLKNACDENTDQIAESFVAFTEGRFAEANEVGYYWRKNTHIKIIGIFFKQMLMGLIDQYESNCMEETPLLTRLCSLRDKCEARLEQLESEFL